jgi:hypothetical protein
MDFGLLLATARRESSLDPRARASTSTAAGMFQFIESTWLDMVRRHGVEHGLGAIAQQIELRGGRSVVTDPAQRRAILDLRFDPEIAARMAGELARENASLLEARLGRAPSAGEIYAAHVLGPAGAARLIEAAASGSPSAAALFPEAARANRGLFYDRSGAPRSAQGLLDRLDIGEAASGTITTPRAPSAVAATGAPIAPAPADGWVIVAPEARAFAAGAAGLAPETLHALIALLDSPLPGVRDETDL